MHSVWLIPLHCMSISFQFILDANPDFSVNAQPSLLPNDVLIGSGCIELQVSVEKNGMECIKWLEVMV